MHSPSCCIRSEQIEELWRRNGDDEPNIAVDEFYPNCGLSGVYLKVGQRLSIRFTLNLGRDIGGLNGAAGEYPEKFIEPY